MKSYGMERLSTYCLRERNPSVTGILRVVYKRQVMQNFDVFFADVPKKLLKKNSRAVGDYRHPGIIVTPLY